MKCAQSSSNIPLPSRLVKVDLPDDRALTIIVDGEAGAFEIAWDVVLTFGASGDPFPSGPPPSSTIVDLGPESAFLDYVRETYGDSADPDYIAAMGSTGPANGRSLRHYRILSHDWGFDVAAIAPPVVRSVIIENGS